MESIPSQWAHHHRQLIAAARWIIDGMKLGVLAERLAAADTVIYLEVSTRACLTGILRRRIRFRGQLRPELAVYDRINWEFVRWIVSFRRRQRPRNLELLTGYDSDLGVVTHRRELRPLLASLNRPARSRIEPESSTLRMSAAAIRRRRSAARRRSCRPRRD